MTSGALPPPSGSSGRAYLLLTVTSVCWAANALFGRLAVGELSPMLLVTLRWLGVLLILAVFARHHARRDWAALRARLPFIGAMGALGFTGFSALLYSAAHTTTAVNIGILQGSIPAFVLIGAFWAYRTPVSGLQLAGVMVTMGGLILVATGGDVTRLAALGINPGDVMMIGACVLYAGYTVALRRRPEVSSLGLLTAIVAAAFVASLPLLMIEAALGRLQWPTATGWIVLLLITVFPSFLAQIFYIRGVQMIGPGRAGIFVNLVPVFTPVLAVTFLGEPFEVFHGAALSLVVVGIWLAERGKAAD